MDKFRLGRHINISNTFYTTPWYAKNLGYDIFQIFLSFPYKILSNTESKNQFTLLGKELVKRDVIMVIHGSYTINLCHPPDSTRFKVSLKSLVRDLDASHLIGENCLGVIIHMGKNIIANNIPDKQALNNYVIGLKKALNATPFTTTIILETGASQGSEVGSKINKLTEIYKMLTQQERKRITFCIDTCHIWATGYDISDSVGVNKFFNEFNDKIGINKISCIHFNDSKTPLDSHVDRHADLGYGFIGKTGLKSIAKFAKKNNIPLITETPLDAINKTTNQEVTFKEEIDTMKLWTKSNSAT